MFHEWQQGTKIIVVDPEREYKNFCENLAGAWVNLGGGKGGRINPLEVKAVPDDDDDDDEMSGAPYTLPAFRQRNIVWEFAFT